MSAGVAGMKVSVDVSACTVFCSVGRVGVSVTAGVCVVLEVGVEVGREVGICVGVTGVARSSTA